MFKLGAQTRSRAWI